MAKEKSLVPYKGRAVAPYGDKKKEKDKDNMMGVMITGMMSMVVLMMGMSMITGYAEANAPAAPTYVYCPICNEPFLTEAELYEHFLAEHPAEPIDIIWE